MNIEERSKPIKKEIAIEMVNAYAKEAKEKSSYTKAAWFPAEQIIQIAETLKDGKHDGLRIYLAQYTADSLDGLPKEYLGRNTVLLVPTLAAGLTGSQGDPTEDREDDTGLIENRGDLCPSMCSGTQL